MPNIHIYLQILIAARQNLAMLRVHYLRGHNQEENFYYDL